MEAVHPKLPYTGLVDMFRVRTVKQTVRAVSEA